MGANRAGVNLRKKRKRHIKNMQTQDAALLRAEQAKTKPAAKKAKAAPKKAKAE
jgi:hypothetical protein